MNALAHRSSRVIWSWCLAYTAVTPRSSRDRRREEMRSHLWEAERAGNSPRRELFAAIAGLRADVAWAATRGLLAVVRSFASPTPYVVLAAVSPLQAWILSSVTGRRVAQVSEGVGALGGVVMLMLAATVWLATRHRSR